MKVCEWLEAIGFSDESLVSYCWSLLRVGLCEIYAGRVGKVRLEVDRVRNRGA